MGICISTPTMRAQRRGGGEGTGWPSTAKVIHVDGKLQEFKYPTTAGHVILQNPNCFLCSSESMNLDSCVPHLGDDEELEIGQIYFLMPLSQSNKLLSLSDLCILAVKASKVLDVKQNPTPSTFSSSRTAVRLAPGARGAGWV